MNGLKATASQVQKELAGESIFSEKITGLEYGLSLTERKNVFVTAAYREGHFEMQDRASQLVAPFLKPQPGLRVIDACAGAGGKTLHIAALLKNRGKLISMDVHDWKLKELRNRARRNGVDIVEVKVINSTKVIKRLQDSADRVLLDVPCSGLGVLRRHPDTKWKLRPDSFAALHKLQAELLQDYSVMTKKGGLLVYATCSFLPTENEKQVSAFLEKNPGWKLEEQLRINHDDGRGDGFFAARLLREQ